MTQGGPMNWGGSNPSRYPNDNRTTGCFPQTGTAPNQNGWGAPAQGRQTPNAYLGTQVPQFLSGKLIDNPDDISVNDVPMVSEGGISIFPSKDGSYILIKTWNNQGTIDTYRYIPEPMVQSQKNGDSNEGFETEVFNRLDKIEKMLQQNRRPYYKPKNNPKPNKEATEE